MEIEDVENFDWLQTDHIIIYQRLFGHMGVDLIFGDAKPESFATIFDANGNEISETALLQIIRNLVPSTDDPETEIGQQIPVRLKVATPGWTATDASGSVWSLDHFKVRTSYELLKSLSPISRHRYTGGDRDYFVASAQFPLDESSGTFIMLQEDDGGASIYFVPEGAKGVP